MSIPQNKIPALRIAITSKCNLKCSFCSKNGENYSCSDKIMTKKDIKNALTACNEIGIKEYRLTGGEPFEDFKRLQLIINTISKFENSKIEMVTNSINLAKHLDFVKSNISLLKISLDSLDGQTYKKMRGVDALGKVLEGIKKAKEYNIPIRINMVVTKDNYPEIPKIISFCEKNKLDLKLLDLNYFESVGKKYWDSNYKSLSDFVKKYREKTKIYTVGGYGIPMTKIKNNDITILIKDSSKGAQYGKICKDCHFLPKKGVKHYCQEGLYALTLTEDGKLKICKHRPDLAVEIKNLDKDKIKEKLNYVLNNYF